MDSKIRIVFYEFFIPRAEDSGNVKPFALKTVQNSTALISVYMPVCEKRDRGISKTQLLRMV